MIYDYIQSDYRWANHPYAGETMAYAGCGPASVADVTGALPPDVADWMTDHGYASNGQGTYWGGIAPACEAYGFSAQQLNSWDLYGQYDTNTERNWLNFMKTGKYYGILLMGRGYFCTSGHFIDIKEVADNNAAYAYDVAYSPRSGWHDWSVYQGMVKVFYIVENKDANKGDAYTFSTQQVYVGCTGLDVTRLECILKARGFYKGKIDGSFGSQLLSAVLAYQKSENLVQDGICGILTWTRLLGLASVNGRWIVNECKIGDMNSTSVLLMQEFLCANGYTVALDWNFGTKTKKQLIAYQKSMKAEGIDIRTDGVFDAKTAHYMIG